jgi:hypothetical protein
MTKIGPLQNFKELLSRLQRVGSNSVPGWEHLLNSYEWSSSSKPNSGTQFNICNEKHKFIP